MNPATDGKRCPTCGEWKPFSEYHRNRSTSTGYQNACKPCLNAANAAARAKKADYWREHYRQRMRDTYAEKRDVRLARAAAWYAEKGAEYHRQWKDENREKVRTSVRKWRAQHVDEQRIKGNNRRAKKLGAAGEITLAEWQALCEQHEQRCACCGEARKLEIDHIVPLKLGGSNWIANIQPLCHPCNTRKKQQSSDYRKSD